LREIQGLSAHFDVLRIDGEDYRHRGAPDAPAPWTTEQVRAAIDRTPGATLDHFRELVAFLPQVHPSQYGALVEGIPLVGLEEVRTLSDQAQALRLVVLVDRLYDRDVPVVASGVPLDSLFTEQLLKGGYRKKYFRAMSRLVALTREGQSDQPQ
jgi:cell division protein ZapE